MRLRLKQKAGRGPCRFMFVIGQCPCNLRSEGRTRLSSAGEWQVCRMGRACPDVRRPADASLYSRTSSIGSVRSREKRFADTKLYGRRASAR
jgi:hypothetical protein